MTTNTKPDQPECAGEITAERFLARVGYAPIQDDLERCNCKRHGEIGHSFCGWDAVRDMPRFIPDAF
jgi:hypothetical protein